MHTGWEHRPPPHPPRTARRSDTCTPGGPAAMEGLRLTLKLKILKRYQKMIKFLDHLLEAQKSVTDYLICMSNEKNTVQVRSMT